MWQKFVENIHKGHNYSLSKTMTTTTKQRKEKKSKENWRMFFHLKEKFSKQNIWSYISDHNDKDAAWKLP